MADARRHHSGLAAEEIAAAAYEAEGGRVLARRHRTAEGEIDLIVRLGGVTVFAEVKHRARASAGADSPVGRRQWQRVAAAALGWMAEHPELADACRFDAVLVPPDGPPVILADAWRPDLEG